MRKKLLRNDIIKSSREVGRGVFGALRQKRTHKGKHYEKLTKTK